VSTYILLMTKSKCCQELEHSIVIYLFCDTEPSKVGKLEFGIMKRVNWH